MDPPTNFDSRTLVRATLAVGVVGALFGIVACAKLGPRVGRDVALGGGLALMHLWITATLVRGLFAHPARAPFYGLMIVLKFIALAGALWVVSRFGDVHLASLAIGYGALPIGLAIGSLLGEKSEESSGPP